MKIRYSESKLNGRFLRGKPVFEYKLVDSILKTHFKELMRLTSAGYKSKDKTGLICEQDKEAFLALVQKIEKSSATRARASHTKTAEKAKTRRSGSLCDHEDLGSLGYTHGTTVRCPHCGEMAEVW